MVFVPDKTFQRFNHLGFRIKSNMLIFIKDSGILGFVSVITLNLLAATLITD
jgi:hypothetical protein